MAVIDDLKALLDNDWSTEHIRQLLPQINALGIHVQNELRGEYRPRFRMPDGRTWDYGPGGWVFRGAIGDWHSGSGDGGGGGGGGGDGGGDGGGGDGGGGGGGGDDGGGGGG